MEERLNKVVFWRVAKNGDLHVIGVSVASYIQEDHSVNEGIILLGS